MNEQTYDQTLDCKGLNCPLPVLKTNKQINTMDTGEVLKIETTDMGSINDLQSWSKQTENEFISYAEDDGKYTFYVRKT